MAGKVASSPSPSRRWDTVCYRARERSTGSKALPRVGPAPPPLPARTSGSSSASGSGSRLRLRLPLQRLRSKSEPAARSRKTRSSKSLITSPRGAGAVVIDTGNAFLYLVLNSRRAIRYGVGVRPRGLHMVWSNGRWPGKPMAGFVRLQTCFLVSPTCRGLWRAGPAIRSALGRYIWVRPNKNSRTISPDDREAISSSCTTDQRGCR